MAFICFIGFISACMAVFLNYCLGKPGTDDFNPRSILSSYTYWLSRQRLKQIGLYQGYANDFEANLKRARAAHEVFTMKSDFRKMIYYSADPFFTWEKPFGMCAVCTGFWISLILGLVTIDNFFELLVIIVISHVIIRILTKIL